MDKKYKVVAGVAVIALLAVVGVVAVSSAGSSEEKPFASAKMVAPGGTEIGTVSFTQEGEDTRVTADLNVPPAARGTTEFHGFHIHANNDSSNGQGCIADPGAAPSTWFVAVDGHWKEGQQVHGSHVGDMPPLALDANGKASASFVLPKLASNQLNGKAVILHAGPDNFGNIPVGDAPNQYKPNAAAATTATANTGNAGDRVACGLIESA